MFGYIVPDKPEMKMKEYDLFKAFYCGICKNMGKNCGNVSRLALNYDCTFLALILTAISDIKPVLTKKRCLLNPFRKKNIIQSPVIEYAADMNAVLAYHKLKDNIRDERDLKSIMVFGFFAFANRRMRKKYPQISKTIEENLGKLSEMEKEGFDNLDEICEPFCNIMQKIMVYEPFIKDKSMIEPLKWMGYNMGKWIYIMDAYDDLVKDAKKGSFNPLIAKYKEDCWSQETKERIKVILFYSLDQIVKAYNLLDVDKVKGIVENIIYSGMFEKTRSVLKMEFDEEGGTTV